jgi:antitoxin ParD1/3/4
MAPEERTISLPAEEARYIDSLVASGSYASASEVVRAALRVLQERDSNIEEWLHEAVVPVYDAMEANPDRGISGQRVTEALSAHHAERMKGRRCP